MNEFGVLLYKDYPRNVEYTVLSASVSLQENATDEIVISDKTLIEEYTGNRAKYDYATLEDGEFDFTKPIWYTGDYIGFASSLHTITQRTEILTITPDTLISGSGITLVTTMKSYSIRITVTLANGTTQSKKFDKTESEFYPFDFEDATSVEIAFLRGQINHFVKILCIVIGGLKIIDESVLVDNPTITTHFSLTNENLEYNTLEFSVLNIGDYAFKEGELITDTRTNRQYYVATANDNDNGIVDVTCYDHIYRMDRTATGSVLNSTSFANKIKQMIKAKYDDVVVSNVESPRANQTMSGANANEPYRDAVKDILLGNGCCLVVKNGNSETENTYINVINPLTRNTPVAYFNNDNIVEGIHIEKSKYYYIINFSSYTYQLNKSEGLSNVFNGNLKRNTFTTLYFDRPNSNKRLYYVSGQDKNGSDILTPVNASKCYIKDGGTYWVSIYNEYSQNIVILAYPYTENIANIEVVNATKSGLWYGANNTLNIDDCNVAIDVDAYGDRNELSEYLAEVYKYNINITFESFVEVECGDYVQIEHDGNTSYGYVTKKTDRKIGLYEYEVVCK